MQKNVDFEALDDVLITLISTPFNVLRSVTLEYKTTYENELYDDLHEKLDGSLGKLYRSLGICNICKYIQILNNIKLFHFNYE